MIFLSNLSILRVTSIAKNVPNHNLTFKILKYKDLNNKTCGIKSHKKAVLFCGSFYWFWKEGFGITGNGDGCYKTTISRKMIHHFKVDEPERCKGMNFEHSVFVQSSIVFTSRMQVQKAHHPGFRGFNRTSLAPIVQEDR